MKKHSIDREIIGNKRSHGDKLKKNQENGNTNRKSWDALS